MFEHVNDAGKDHGHKQCGDASLDETRSTAAALPTTAATQDETEGDREAVSRWIDEGNPNCQGL